MQEVREKLKRSARLQTMTGLVFAASIIVLFSIDLRFRYQNAITQGKKTALNFAEILSEQTALSFENVERTLREAEKIRKDSLAGNYATSEDVNAALRLLMKTSPVVIAVGWTDTSGELRAHSYDRQPPRTNIAGMTHFTAQRDSIGGQLYLSPPFRSATSDKWLTAASIRLSNKDGSFAGVVSAPLDPSYFAKIYRSIDLGTNGAILLMHTSGGVLAREPTLESAIGKSFASAPLLTKYLPRAERGSYETVSALDGVSRLAGYKAVRGLPLVQLVSFTRADVLRPWYRHILIFGPMVALVVAFILLGTFLIVRQTNTVIKKSASLARKSRELEETNSRFDIALSHMPHGLVMWDAEHKIVVANSRYRDMYGLKPEQVQPGVSLRQILQSHLANGESSDLDIDEYIKVVVAQTAQTHILADGRTVSMRRLRMPDGGWIATHEDITEQQQIEAALRSERDRAEAAARATAEFLANMSHELRTPLTAIIGVSDMLLSRSQSPETQRHFMEMQRSAGRGLLGIINNILDFSKIEAGQLDLEAAPFSLTEVVESCIKLVTEQAEQKGLEVNAVVENDVPDWVRGDAARLRQVLINLVANGVKFTHSGTITMTVGRVPGVTNAVRFAVTDTGIGIDTESLSTIFDRFAQADTSTTRRFGGTGLGLAVSKRLVVLMGGDIQVQSKLDRGSTFSFTIELAGCSKLKLEPQLVLPSSRSSYRLLLAEDNALNRQLIKAMLEQAGHEVVTVNDGAEAVRVAVRNRFDAILMDVQMPEMDGYAATRAIRSTIQDNATLPIIALTANALSDESERCLAAGMNVHMPKPVNWPVLFATIDRLVLENQALESTVPATATGSEGELAASENRNSFEEIVLAQLRNAIGDQNTASLLKLFVVEARQRFVSQPASPEARESIAQEAHAFGGSAGMLGFEGLAKACAALHSAALEGRQFDEYLDQCRRARDAALSVIAYLIVDDEFVGPVRTTA